MIYDEETIGITDEDRAYHLKWHYIGSIILSAMCAFLGYSIFKVYSVEDDVTLKAFRELDAFYISFTIIFAARLVIRLYLIC
jgi:hypothetical protein